MNLILSHAARGNTHRGQSGWAMLRKYWVSGGCILGAPGWSIS